MKFKRFYKTPIVMILFLFLVFAGCGEKELTKVKMSYKKNTNAHSVFVAMDQGYFKAEGLDVEWVEFQSTNIIIQALVAGQIDATPLSSVPTIYGVEQNSPGTIQIYLVGLMATGRFSDAIIVGKDSTFSSLSDLKGKKVGVFPGSASQVLLKRILKNFFEPENNVTMVEMEPKILLQALGSGQVDAVLSFEPLTTIALEKGIAKVLIQEPVEKYVMDPMPFALGVMTTKFINKHPKTAKKIINAMYKTVDFMRENPEETMRITARALEMSEERALKLKPFLYWKLDEVDKKVVQDFAELLYQGGDLKEKVDTTQMYLDLSKL